MSKVMRWTIPVNFAAFRKDTKKYAWKAFTLMYELKFVMLLIG